MATGTINVVKNEVIAETLPAEGSITLTPSTHGAHLLLLSRANNSMYCAIMYDYWSASVNVFAGTLPSNLWVAKNAASDNVSITNHLSFAVGYTLV